MEPRKKRKMHGVGAQRGRAREHPSTVLTNRIDCPYLLANVNSNVPHRTLRTSSLLRSTAHRTLYGMNEPLNRISNQFNLFEDLFDFGMDRNRFKTVMIERNRAMNRRTSGRVMGSLSRTRQTAIGMIL